MVVSGWLLVVTCLLGWALLALAAMDWRSFVLVDELTLTLIPAGAAVAYMLEPNSVVNHLLGAAIGYASFALLGFGYRKLRRRDGLGIGDAKLLAAAGAWLSWTGLPSVVLIGTVAGLAFIAVKTLAGRPISASQRLPFGTFLSLGLWLAWLYGPIVVA